MTIRVTSKTFFQEILASIPRAAIGLQIVVGIIAGFTLFGSIYFVVPTRRLPWWAVDLASGPKRPLAARHTR